MTVMLDVDGIFPPVGGHKQSGCGRENGIVGMQSFLQTKSVWLATAPHQPNPFE